MSSFSKSRKDGFFRIDRLRDTGGGPEPDGVAGSIDDPPLAVDALDIGRDFAVRSAAFPRTPPACERSAESERTELAISEGRREPRGGGGSELSRPWRLASPNNEPPRARPKLCDCCFLGGIGASASPPPKPTGVDKSCKSSGRLWPISDTARDGGIEFDPAARAVLARLVGELGVLLLGNRELESDGAELESPSFASTSVTDADAVPQLEASSSGGTMCCMISLPLLKLMPLPLLLLGLLTSWDVEERWTDSESSKNVDIAGDAGRAPLVTLGRRLALSRADLTDVACWSCIGMSSSLSRSRSRSRDGTRVRSAGSASRARLPERRLSDHEESRLGPVVGDVPGVGG